MLLRLLLFFFLSQSLAAVPAYEAFRSGRGEDATPETSPGLVLMGGGADVAEAFGWMIERGGGGDVLVLRASGTDAYNPYISRLAPVNSVETLIFHSREASSDPSVLARIERAEAIFIAGGDQARYYELWAGTPLADAVARASRRVPVGGTSAGLAVLGEQAFSARMGTLTSEQVLNNPLSSAITLEPGLFHLERLQGVLTDSHFNQRSRRGRLLGFLAQLWHRGQRLRGVGVDEGTALLLDDEGGRVVGRNQVTWLLPAEPPEQLSPFSWTGVGVLTLKAGDRFSWPELQARERISVRRGVLGK